MGHFKSHLLDIANAKKTLGEGPTTSKNALEKIIVFAGAENFLGRSYCLQVDTC